MTFYADLPISGSSIERMAMATRAMIHAVETPKAKDHFCLLMTSDQPFARGKSQWQAARFASLEQAQQFLVELSVWVFPSPDSQEQEELASIYRNIALSMLDGLGDQAQDLMPLNTLVKGLFCIQWAGKGQ